MFGGSPKGKARDGSRWTVSKGAKTTSAGLTTASLTPWQSAGVAGHGPQHVYGSRPFAATTSNLLSTADRYTQPEQWPLFQSTMDISQDLAAQTSNFYHASIDAANDLFDNSLYQSLSSKLDSVITSIDGDGFSGSIKDLSLPTETQDSTPRGGRGGGGGGGSSSSNLFKRNRASKGANKAVSFTLTSTNYFSKTNLYANSKLSPSLPTLELLAPAYPLLCLAAQYSARAYTKASGQERDAHIPSDWRLGTKAMVIKSVPIDHIDCVVFAIRGSQTFMDWAVNLHSAPEPPENFLDDPGNLCHSGFLSVARKMIKPVAARLRQLLEENPARSTCSLLMTGHSAGGAVATLLFAHMLAEQVSSELSILAGCFKRIHCLTFGAPPVTLLPLRKTAGERNRKSLFMSFINEGDPVPRADPSYVRSLLRLYASPAPATVNLAKSAAKGRRASAPRDMGLQRTMTSHDFVWEVPPGTLSNAGRLVVLRGSGNGEDAKEAREDDVKALVTSDADLRSVVFGDPIMHMMKVYLRRIEVLATKAATANLLT